MDLVALLNGLVAQLADAKKAADDLAAAKFQEGASSRDEEVAALKAEIEELKKKPDLQADLDAALAQVADLQSQVVALQASVDQKVAEAIVITKADILAKFDAQQASESESEVSFRELLK